MWVSCKQTREAEAVTEAMLRGFSGWLLVGRMPLTFQDVSL